MKRKRNKLLCLFLAVITVLSLIPTTVMAADCTHSYDKKYRYENSGKHSYASVCSKCGTEATGSGYSGWEDHTFDAAGTCTKCGFSNVCSHSNKTRYYNNLSTTQHEYYTHCNGCGINYYFTTEDHSYSGAWQEYSSTQHKRTGTCACGAAKIEYQNHTISGGACTVCGYIAEESGATDCSHTNTTRTCTGYSDTQHKTVTRCSTCNKQINSVLESHTFSGNTCTECGYTKTAAVTASVSLSASSSAGTLGSAGGEISAEGAPASYTVTASATGCSVTKIVYTQNGKTYTVNSSSVTITASAENDFTTTTFTAYTSVSGVTATFTVNHKVVRHNVSQVMWETSYTAVIRSITGNGMNKSLNYTMTIPNSYEGQSNLSSDQINTIQSLIGVSDGKTYTVNYTRTITVYTPAVYSSTGSRVDLGTFDGNNSTQMNDCLSRWGWSSTTAAAIRQAASSSLTFTTGTIIDCTAKWINTEDNRQIYLESFGDGIVTADSSRVVAVSYTDYSGSASYVFEKLTYSGDTSGTSTNQSFSMTYTAASKPLTVMFYCHPSSPSQTEEDGTGDITVYVRDRDTDELLSGATVSGAKKKGTTNASGGVLFPSLTYGTYSFTVTKTGYTTNSGSATISQSAPTKAITIYISRDTSGDSDGEEETYGNITIYVRDAETNALIVGAKVTGCGTTRYTTSYGCTTYSNVSFGTYTFTADEDGYGSGSTSVTLTSDFTSKTATIYLTPEEDESDLPTVGDITVYVRDQTTNEVISGAAVTCNGSAQNTSTVGYTTFNSVPFGSYSVSASKAGYNSNSQIATISASSASTTVTVYLPRVLAATVGSITVNVLDKESDDPIPDAFVTIASTTLSAPDGQAAFRDMAFGFYTITASANGYGSASTTVTISETEPDKEATVYLSKTTLDVSITANDVNGEVYRGSTIMVAATVHTDSSIDFTPDNPLTVMMEAYQNGSTCIDSQTKTVICPKNESNLVWFAITIPESGYTSNSISFSFEVVTPSGVTEISAANNKSSKSVTPVVLPTRSTPQTSLELNAPSDYNGSSYTAQTSPSRSWSVWEWNGSSFTKKNYSAKLTTTAALSPDSSAVWKKQNATSKLWTTRSGYGLITSVSVSCTGLKSGMLAGNAKVNAYYPEFNYSTAEEKSNMLLRTSENATGYTASYTFAEDPNNLNNAKMHKSPVWFPDGEYSVKYEVYDLWTPAGMLTGTTYAIVNIEGSIYNDYYTNRS